MDPSDLSRRDPLAVLGIDPGTRVAGWGVLGRTAGRTLWVDHGTLRLPAEAALPERLRRLKVGLDAVLDHHRPDAVVLERAYFGRNAQSALRLGEARGVALLAAAERALPLFELTAGEAKKAALGDGRAPKSEVRAMLGRRLEVDLSAASEDASDALALAFALLHDPRLDPRFAAPTGRPDDPR